MLISEYQSPPPTHTSQPSTSFTQKKPQDDTYVADRENHSGAATDDF